MSRSAREHIERAHKKALEKAGCSGVYHPAEGEPGEPEYFSVTAAQDWVGDQVQISVTEFLIGMMDRDYDRGDQVVTDDEGSYKIITIHGRESGLLTLLAEKLPE